MLAVLVLVWAGTASAQQTHNPLPAAGSSFLPTLNTYLLNEDAQRFVDMFRNFVVSGGVLAPVPGATGTPSALTAYAAGYYLTETGSITFPNSSTCWLIASWQTTGNLTTFVRVPGTHYLIDCTSVAQPAQPAAAVYLAEVQTAGGSIVTVTDLRPLTVIGVAQGGTGLTGPFVVGDIPYATTTTSWGTLPDAADGNVLRSGGVGSAPLYGKVRLDGAVTDISGVLAQANGGLGTASGANGTIPIGNGSGFTVATLTAGANIVITNGPGSIAIAADNAVTSGYRCLAVSSLTTSSFVVGGCNGLASSIVEVNGTLLTRLGSTMSTGSSIRALVAGSGSLTVTSASTTLTFSTSQSLSLGDTVRTQAGKLFTIRTGSGTSWTAFQASSGNEGPVSFTRSSATADPAGPVPGGGPAVSDSLLFLYAAPSGTTPNTLSYYLDTSAPTAGYHPYNTTHRWAGFQVYVDGSGNLDTAYTWNNGRLAVRLAGSFVGPDYAVTAATYADVDATRLRRPVYFASGAQLVAVANWDFEASTTTNGVVALSVATVPGTPLETSVFGQVANIGILHGNDTAAVTPSSGIGIVGLAFKSDGATALTISNDGNGAPRGPTLLLEVTQ